MPTRSTARRRSRRRAAQLRRGVPLNGTRHVDGERYLYAARLVRARASFCCGPRARRLGLAPPLEGSSSRPRRPPPSPHSSRSSRPRDRPSRAPRRRAAPRARGRASRREPVPVEGARELALLAESFNESAAQLAKRAGGRARVPALGQPRAEDPADRDPRLRGGARATACSTPARRQRRSAARRRLERLVARPPRPRADEQERIQRPPRADRPRRDRPRGAAAATRARRATFGVALDAAAHGARRRSATPTGCCRSSRTSSRTPCA